MSQSSGFALQTWTIISDTNHGLWAEPRVRHHHSTVRQEIQAFDFPEKFWDYGRLNSKLGWSPRLSGNQVWSYPYQTEYQVAGSHMRHHSHLRPMLYKGPIHPQ